MANPKEIRGINSELNKLFNNLTRIEAQFIETRDTMDKGSKMISEQAKKNAEDYKKLSGAREKDRAQIAANEKQARDLVKAQADISAAYKNNAIEILKLKKLKQEMVTQQKLELQAGKGQAKTLGQLNAQYKLAAKRALDLTVKLGENNAKTQEAIAKAKAFKAQITQTNKVLRDEKKVLTELEKATAAHARASTNDAKEVLRVKQATADLVRQQKLTIAAGRGEVKTYEQLSARYRIAAQKAKDLAAAYGRNSKQARNAARSAARYNKELLAIDQSLGNNQRNVGNYTAGIKNLVAGYLGFQSVVRVFKNIGGIVTKFSNAQSNLAAVLGKTRGEIGDLSDDAKKYGRETAFTASEVSNLQTELAKLGFVQREIKASTESVLGLAQATGADLGSAAKVSGAALRAFGLDATEMERVTSVLAVATSKSALSFSDYESALSTVAPVAKTFGFGIEDTVAMLGKLKDAGFDASSAATSTRNILLNLADSNGKLAKSLGAPIKNFDELVPALVKLRNKGVDLNETLQLTDKRSVAAFNQFLAGAEGAKELRDSLIDVSDEMQAMVDTQLNNLTGDLDKLNSAWEGLVQSVEDGTGPISAALRSFAQGLTGVLGIVTKLNEGESLRLQQLKETEDFEARIVAIKKKSTELVGMRAEAESKSRAEIIDDLILEAEFRRAAQIIKIKSLEGDRKAREEFNRDITKETIEILQDLAAKETALEEKKLKEFEKNQAKKVKTKEKTNKQLFAADLKLFKLEQELQLLRLKNSGATEMELATFKLHQKEKLYSKEIELAEKWVGAIGDKEIEILKEKQIEAGLATEKAYKDSLLKRRELPSAIEGEGISQPSVTGDEVSLEEKKSIWEQMGMTDEEGEKVIDSAKQTASALMDILNQFADDKIAAADRVVENADREVDSAERNLDRQISLAEAGYANDVTGAQKALDLQKQTQQQALAEQKRAVAEKQRLDTIQQGASLITAGASIIQGFSTIPIVGWALGIAAVGAMLAAFVSTKVKAKQASQSFGDGGVIDLEGGSHASGNDIMIGRKDGKDLKAEGGEKHAIFTKRSSRKYGKEINSFVAAANKGNLEERHSKAFSLEALPIIIEKETNYDSAELRNISRILAKIEQLTGGSSTIDRDGVEIVKKGNITRRIRRG